jgi:hypothetical protein
VVLALTTGGILMSSSVTFLPAVPITLLITSLKELALAYREYKEIRTANGVEKVDGVIELPNKERVGVRIRDGKPLEIVVPENVSAETKNTVKKLKQNCSRLKMLDETKRLGYSKVKEEKLKDGSIRIVVQRWQ